MHRTQLYFEETLFSRLVSLSKEKGTTVSDLVRKAVEKMYGKAKKKDGFEEALKATAGLWKDRKDLPSTEEYIRSLREDTRMKRFGLE
jgi:hypothetical protein